MGAFEGKYHDTYVCYHGHFHDGNRADGSACPDETRAMRKKRREALEVAKHGITPEEEATAYPKEDAR